MGILAVAGMMSAVLAQESADQPTVNRTEASQIEMPQTAAGADSGRAYLDQGSRTAPAPAPSARVAQTAGDATLRAQGRTPASQITARGQGGLGVVQLSKADLDATLAQLTPAERRVLLQAIEGTDICNDPPDVAAIQALCQTRIETRSAEFATGEGRQFSAEDRLLQGDLESATLPSVGQVIERLARGSASSGDFNNQAIASIALGTTVPPPSRQREEEQSGTGNLGEEAQALINALINQLGGRAP
jgi:hypothetical protein